MPVHICVQKYVTFKRQSCAAHRLARALGISKTTINNGRPQLANYQNKWPTRSDSFNLFTMSAHFSIPRNGNGKVGRFACVDE